MLNNEVSREALQKAKRIVIKVGTSTITYANGKRNFSQIDRLAREISDLQNQGKEMILVTSGAVAVGVDRMGLPGKPKTIPGKQAAAAVGQGVLMHTYEKFFADYGQIVAQVLITKTEAIDRHRYTNTRNTFMELMRQRVIPIVNENDVVALDELKIGDNDNMSALVAGIVDADLVIILSDVDGLYTANPQTHPDAVIVPEVAEITPEIEASAGGVGSARGTGGMATKIQAAKLIECHKKRTLLLVCCREKSWEPCSSAVKTVCSSASAGWHLVPKSPAVLLWMTVVPRLFARQAAAVFCRQACLPCRVNFCRAARLVLSTRMRTSWHAA